MGLGAAQWQGIDLGFPPSCVSCCVFCLTWLTSWGRSPPSTAGWCLSPWYLPSVGENGQVLIPVLHQLNTGLAKGLKILL